MTPSFEYTQGNHFKWGYGDEWYNKPDPTKQFKIQLGYCTRPVERFRNECINAAKLIAEKASKPIIVGLSGGSDSQIVCLSLMSANIPFKVVIVRLLDKDGDLLNGYDIKTAYKFCNKYNVEYIEHTIDVDEFYRGKGSEYAAKYGFTAIDTLIQCSTMDFVCKDYCYIMAGGDIIFSPYHNSATPKDIKPHLTNTGDKITTPVWWQSGPPIMQHMINMGYEGTSKFFLYTPELIAAYLTDQAVTDFIRAQDIIYEIYFKWHPDHKMWWKCFHYLYKPLMTMREWPEMISARKYTGSENIQGFIKGKHFGTTLAQEYRQLLANAANGQTGSQVVVTTITDLIEYISTPHTDSLLSTPLILNS